ncbi:MAG: type II secretion system protein [Acidobacteria bacterium]|nr:type II secretion system protein [Acidobacteriota bacterium]MBK8150885.1 type II secretion system protein [Acidobacteriota bacterium]MBK8812200.1 type II secretion system protein [Acidobacteriota bacterium]
MSNSTNQKGFSVIELIVVMMVIAVASAIAMYSFNNITKTAADDQARKIIDVLDEARQKALNQRTTFRVEINKTKNRIILIDENSIATANDDVVIKSEPLSSSVVIGAKPDNVTTTPTATSPIPVPQYLASNYVLSSGDQKITLRFRRNGQVVDAGTDGIGTGSLVSGATIYVHSNTPSVTSPNLVRAVTVLGSTGDTALLKCTFDTYGRCGSWVK